MKTIVCPECGEVILVSADEAEVSARLVCENCYSTLEIVSENPIEVTIVDIDPDELDEDDFDEDDIDE